LSFRRCRIRSKATSASTVQCTMRTWARPLERFQPRVPDPVLKGRLGHRGHPGSQQQLQHSEEDRQRPHGQLVTRARHETWGGVHHPLLDLVPADRRAPHRGRELVGQGGLARTRRTADDHERGQRAHPPSYS
jgi:hypothetical protein